jgi:hypothetical protein
MSLPGDKKPEFQLHRADRDANDGGGFPLGIVAVLLLVVVGGWFAFGRAKGPEKAGSPTPSASVESREVVEVPDAVWSRLDFLENEGREEEALAYAEEQLASYYNPKLVERIRALKRSTSGEDERDTRSTGVLLLEAQKALRANNLDRVIELMDVVLDAREEENGEAYFLRGLAKGLSGEASEAEDDLGEAAGQGVDEARIAAARARISR